MIFKAEAKIPDNISKCEFINRLRMKNIYPAIFGDVVKVELKQADVHQAKYVISVYEVIPNQNCDNSLRLELRPT